MAEDSLERQKLDTDLLGVWSSQTDLFLLVDISWVAAHKNDVWLWPKWKPSYSHKRFVYQIPINSERYIGHCCCQPTSATSVPFAVSVLPPPDSMCFARKWWHAQPLLGDFLGLLELPYQYGELEVLGTLHPTRTAPSQWQTGAGHQRKAPLLSWRENIFWGALMLQSTPWDHADAGTSPEREPSFGCFPIPDLLPPFHCPSLLDASLMHATCISWSASDAPKLRQRAVVRAVQPPGGEGVKQEES